MYRCDIFCCSAAIAAGYHMNKPPGTVQRAVLARHQIDMDTYCHRETYITKLREANDYTRANTAAGKGFSIPGISTHAQQGLRGFIKISLNNL